MQPGPLSATPLTDHAYPRGYNMEVSTANDVKLYILNGGKSTPEVENRERWR